MSNTSSDRSCSPSRKSGVETRHGDDAGCQKPHEQIESPKVERIALYGLKLNSRNVRPHRQKQIRSLAGWVAGIRRLGGVPSIVIVQRSTILTGHGRRHDANKAGGQP